MKNNMKSIIVVISIAAVILSVFVTTASIAESSSVRNADGIITNPQGYVTVLTLNPTWSPGGACLEPFSSVTGYLGTPEWEHHTVDLSAYDHKIVNLRFYFDTRDSLFNKFEGWYVDNIELDGFSDDVESGNIGWTIKGSHATPAWHISTQRSAVTATHSWLYEDETLGTFQAGPSPGDCSDQRNRGTLTSPMICLGSSPKLEFDTLWEIESVAPNAFDMMRVQIEIKHPWAKINKKLNALIGDVNAATVPNILKQRLIDKLEYAKELKENAKEEYEACNVDAATKKLSVAKNEVESFESMVKITRRISQTDKDAFLKDSAEIKVKMDTLIGCLSKCNS